MKAIGVEYYGPVDRLESREVPKPTDLQPRDILVRIKGVSVNPVDTKVRNGTYDDYPDYYDRVPRPFQIPGYDAAGTVEAVGSECSLFKAGDDVFYSGSPIQQGSNAEYQLVDERSVGHKPKTLDFVKSAAMPLTYVTAYEALVERLEIKKGEQAALLIINGAGGVGAMATQIARVVLGLPVVITTASRPETIQFTKDMGATHVVNHREDVPSQIEKLNLDLPLKYIFITHSTDQYMDTCAQVCAPFGKVCSIVQGQAKMYGTAFMSKSLTFTWCLLGTKPYHQIDVESHHRILEELAALIDAGKIKCHLTKRLRLTLEGVKEGHEILQSGGSIGKVGLGVDEAGSRELFA
ncbi:zinc-binding alcohol dehydrogenase family protein [Aspergillus ibericus CBS 121593]|uniref:Quinone oxidoreductase n=1 Tax=Aspergillus ibericus CBS 121593 TaxID=1448316 RepID=A0A395GVX6_9EURO|nr:quinone oxidoreductase [Aspergillus ibericus CBS 121593]RAK99562.1 quinone oxidoreductase [Aspergillus ibericus CBS 121593]